LTATPGQLDSPSRREHLRYRPHLDGLRAIAVYLVVAFHSGLGGFSGGFIGVDVFYVLSGFLVTSILLRDLVSLGHIDWRRFYSRRVRRILPAAILTLLVTAVAYSVIASPSEAQDSFAAFRAAFLYFANWFFIHQSTNYFAGNLSGNPVLHFWSLAVEEQLYVLWPLVFGGLYVVTRSVGNMRWWALRVAVLAIGLTSCAEALYFATTNIDRAYYGTDTRAYQLLAGAFVALTPQLLQLGLRFRSGFERFSAAALGCLVLMGTSALDVGPITRGAIVAVLAAALITSLEHASGGVARRLLSSTPLTYLGRVSYGIYLWHWPIVVFATRNRQVDPIALFVFACGASTALAAVSFHLIEHPVRAARALDRYRTPIIASGLAISAIGGLAFAPAILNRNSGLVSGTFATSKATGTRLLNWRVAKLDAAALPDCLLRRVEKCQVARGSGLRLILVGDSNAHMWIPTLTADRATRVVVVVVVDRCIPRLRLAARAPICGCGPRHSALRG
jgi:peptidoglycan/LPS O-acetylase OafA/YrhL